MPEAILLVALTVGVVDYGGIEQDKKGAAQVQISDALREIGRSVLKGDRLRHGLVGQGGQHQLAEPFAREGVVHRLEIRPALRLVMETRRPHGAGKR